MPLPPEADADHVTLCPIATEVGENVQEAESAGVQFGVVNEPLAMRWPEEEGGGGGGDGSPPPPPPK